MNKSSRHGNMKRYVANEKSLCTCINKMARCLIVSSHLIILYWCKGEEEEKKLVRVSSCSRVYFLVWGFDIVMALDILEALFAPLNLL